MTANNAVVQVDLAGALTVGLLRLKLSADSIDTVQVQSSVDGSTFSSADSYPIGDGAWHIIRLTQRLRRYWRFSFAKGSGFAAFNLMELALYEVLLDFETDASDRPFDIQPRFFGADASETIVAARTS